MASNSKQDNAAPKESILSKYREFFRNETTKFITGMLLMFFSAFLFLSFSSFFFTGDADQALLENLPLSQLTDVSNDIQNWTGVVGAYLAQLFINRWFGLSAFAICYFLGFLSLRLLNATRKSVIRAFLLSNVALIWGSLFFGFFFISSYEDSFIYLGGAHGYYLSLLMKANIGWFGTFLVLTATFVTVLVLVDKNVIQHFKNTAKYIIRKIAESWASYKENRETKKELRRLALAQARANAQMAESAQQEPTPQEEIQQQEIPVTDQTPTQETPEEEADEIQETVAEETVIAQEEIAETEEILQPEEETEEIPPVIKEDNDWLHAPQDEDLIEEPKAVITPQPVIIEESIPEKKTRPEISVEAVDPRQPQPAAPEKDDTDFTVTTGNEDDIVNISELGEYDPTLDLSHYQIPGFDLLNQYSNSERNIDMEEQSANKDRIERALKTFGIEIQSISATVGPTVTLFEIVPKEGVRIKKIQSLEDDIALNLSALGIRIIAPIPGKGTIGIEVPNKDPQVVSMYSVIASRKFQECSYELPVALGKTITNEIMLFDLAKAPHLLVAGATGQGKSVGLNAIITSLLYKKHPSQLKFVLVDPKKVEFTIYRRLEKHFLAKLDDDDDAIITDVNKVIATLTSLCKEMDQRYDLLKMAEVRNIKEYNAKFKARMLNPNNGHRYLPYIVVIIDEYGDLIMVAGREVELPIARIAQLARAVGIHMIIATQRPSANIITGIIKANFPARIAFRVSSMIDSRTILDASGANQLIGRGDLLYSQGGETSRVQCAFVDTPEVENIAKYIGGQQGYPTPFYLPEVQLDGDDGNGGASSVDLKDRDPMFEDAARMVVGSQQGSTSMIQRKFSIGYNRAGRIMDQLEAAGIVGNASGSKPREVLVMDLDQLEQVLDNLK